MHVGFAQDDGASLFEGSDYWSVMQGNEVLQNFGATGGADTSRVDVVLQRNGDAVERAEIAGAFAAAFGNERGLGARGLPQGLLLAKGQVGIEAWVQPADAIEEKARELDGRELGTAVETGDFVDRSEGELSISGHQ